MSGHDETFLPPDGEEAKLPPHPPTHAPPNFGQSSMTGKPSVVFQTADTQPGASVFSGSSVASDAEETMTPPPSQRPGAATPDAQRTANPHEAADGTPPNGAAPVTAPTQPRAAMPPPTSPPSPRPADDRRHPALRLADAEAPYGTPVPEAERTVTDGTGGTAARRPPRRTRPLPFPRRSARSPTTRAAVPPARACGPPARLEPLSHAGRGADSRDRPGPDAALSGGRLRRSGHGAGARHRRYGTGRGPAWTAAGAPGTGFPAPDTKAARTARA